MGIIIGAAAWCIFGIVTSAAGSPGLGAFFITLSIMMVAGATGF